MYYVQVFRSKYQEWVCLKFFMFSSQWKNLGWFLPMRAMSLAEKTQIERSEHQTPNLLFRKVRKFMVIFCSDID